MAVKLESIQGLRPSPYAGADMIRKSTITCGEKVYLYIRPVGIFHLTERRVTLRLADIFAAATNVASSKL